MALSITAYIDYFAGFDMMEKVLLIDDFRSNLFD